MFKVKFHFLGKFQQKLIYFFIKSRNDRKLTQSILLKESRAEKYRNVTL